MTAISIEPVQTDDIPALAEIGRKTFEQTFASANNPCDFATSLDRALSCDRLSKAMSNPEARFSFAKVGDRIAGYLKVNRGSTQTEKVEGRTLEIERIYVDAGMQGTGVGKALFQYALQEADTIGANAVWLGVWEDNPKAIEFYSRQGFKAFGKHRFTIGKDVQRDILMRRDF